ncbi:MAG: tetratricopeptide repeat protein [Planctomycetes bacterium]|nr:tetratricopeptide repeat protein [Planctomycetota bacterium]
MGPALYRLALKTAVALTVIFGGIFLRSVFWPLSDDSLYQQIFWAGAALLVSVFLLGKAARSLFYFFRFPLRLRALLPGEGKPKQTLYQSVLALHREQEERAIAILDQLPANVAPEIRETAQWLRAYAGTRWLMRMRRAVSSYRERYPHLQALLFSHGRVVPRRQILARELAEVSSVQLDQFAKSYIVLMDRMIAALGDRRSPFHGQAEEILEFLTGRSYMVGAKERFEQWWKELKPVMRRGGGALFAGVRLLQRECFAEAAQLLARVGDGGMLSEETETVRRSASYFAMITRPQWRLTTQDIPRYFNDLHYLNCVEMGVLRYPAAELPEVVSCCQRARKLREAKKAFIGDVFKLWQAFGEELARPLAMLLRRLLDHEVRPWPARYAYWRKQWEDREKDFEEPVVLMMEGVAAAAGGHLAAANLLFERSAKLDPKQSTPYANMVYLRLAAGKEDEARKLAQDLLTRFPQEPAAYIAMGRLYAQHLKDAAEAERLFQRAFELDRTTSEPLICLAELKLADGKYNESQEYFDHAKQLDPGSPEAKLGLARIYMETKRWELAVQYLQSVSQESLGDTQHLAHYYLYRTFREIGNDRLAIEYLDKVPTPFFKEPDLLDDIAFHLESERMYAKAKVFSERAMLLRSRGREQRGGLLPPPEL